MLSFPPYDNKPIIIALIVKNRNFCFRAFFMVKMLSRHVADAVKRDVYVFISHAPAYACEAFGKTLHMPPEP